MKNVIIEGARGTGKSTVARILRDKVLNSTLINFTGFNEGGEEGLEKVIRYYDAWFEFFWRIQDMDVTFIHDRYYFSEMVYSKLYKDYDFTRAFQTFNSHLENTFDDFHIILLVTDDREKLMSRLSRDKEKLFGRVTEDANNSFTQQDLYFHYMRELYTHTRIEYSSIVVDNLTPEEVAELIIDRTQLLQS